MVLVVEDDRDTHESLTDLLGNEGYLCVGAFDGRKGLSLLEEHRPDLVLLDLKMPGMSGTDFLRGKATIPAVAETPVIVITALSSPPLLDWRVTLLRKPFGWERLRRAVRKVAPLEGPAA